MEKICLPWVMKLEFCWGDDGWLSSPLTGELDPEEPSLSSMIPCQIETNHPPTMKSKRGFLLLLSETLSTSCFRVELLTEVFIGWRFLVNSSVHLRRCSLVRKVGGWVSELLSLHRGEKSGVGARGYRVASSHIRRRRHRQIEGGWVCGPEVRLEGD